jgi:hypothetical protein
MNGGSAAQLYRHLLTMEIYPKPGFRSEPERRIHHETPGSAAEYRMLRNHTIGYIVHKGWTFSDFTAVITATKYAIHLRTPQPSV